MIRQGDIYWVDLDEPDGSEPGFRRPHVVLQNNLFNQSRIATVLVCALSTNLSRANVPGNVLLKPGEANLPKQSVIVISQLSTVDKRQLVEYVGTLSARRVQQAVAGLMLLVEPNDVE